MIKQIREFNLYNTTIIAVYLTYTAIDSHQSLKFEQFEEASCVSHGQHTDKSVASEVSSGDYLKGRKFF